MIKNNESKWQTLRKFLDDYLQENTQYRAGVIYQAYIDKNESANISRKDFEMFLRDQVMKNDGLLKRVSHGVYEIRTDPNDKGMMFSRSANAETRTITLDEILDDSVELASKINTVLKCLNNQSDISFSAQMELKRLNACLTQSMDTAITGITSVMAWCEDNMGIESQDETEELTMSF